MTDFMEWFFHAVDTDISSDINSQIFVRFRFRIDIIGTDDFSHSGPHRYLTPNFTFAFTFVILKVINSEKILFRFTLISTSMVSPKPLHLPSIACALGPLMACAQV